ncbi:MAG: glutamate--tRNA ligase [Alphaproteobacteria bacterium]|nr:glutamate--tRNA ligase [Alphaproteobacteria bacterium]
MSVKVRFAPSPTGLLHVGNIRIAILNYIFVKKNGGKFVLRIDDTDTERSTKESEELILEDLRWLGIQWDEFYKQSNHFAKYAAAMEHLKKIGRVYACYETKEELSLKRKIQASQGVPPVYDRASLQLTDEQKKELEAKGVKPYWRFKLNQDDVVEWNDLVHGKISIPLNSISDPILIKPDGSYVYTFASVVDDVNIGITHIIRGDDHITNTAAQIDMFKTLSDNIPQFAHVPLLSSLDGQDVSKRTGSPLSIVNMRKDGIEPSVIWNVLATLGTSNNANYRDSVEDLIEKFSFEKMSLSSPKFNIEDVKLLTKKVIADKSFDEVKLHFADLPLFTEDFWNAVKGNIESLSDVRYWYDIFFKDIAVVKEDATFVQQMLQVLPSPFDFAQWIAELKNISGRKGRDLFHPIRMVITGVEKGPELGKIADLIGYNRLKSRIEANLKAN